MALSTPWVILVGEPRIRRLQRFVLRNSEQTGQYHIEGLPQAHGQIMQNQNIRWISSGRSDRGAVRSINEDAILTQDDKCFWVVADGLGGHAVGDVASRKLVAGLADVPLKNALDLRVEKLEDKLIDVNHQLLQYAKQHCHGSKMGSTVVCLLIKNRVGVCLWVGDSRLYRYRNRHLSQMMRDHSHVEELVKRGMLTRAEANMHPQRNIVTRAIGADADLYVEINVFGVRSDDVYLLCSDGLYEVLDAKVLAQGLSRLDVDDSAAFLMERALRAGARDNVSLVVVKAVSQPG